MWIATISSARIAGDGRWKVEAYTTDVSGHIESVFNLAAVRDVVVERREFMDPQDQPGATVAYVGLENVAPQTGDLIDFSPVRASTIKSRAKVFREGDVLYGRLRPYLNKVYLAEAPVSAGICSTEFYVLVPDGSLIHPRFLRELLSSKFIQDHAPSLQAGSALPRLHLDDLFNMRFPLPPLEVQHAVALELLTARNHRLRLTEELTSQPQRIRQEFERVLTVGLAPSEGSRPSGSLRGAK